MVDVGWVINLVAGAKDLANVSRIAEGQAGNTHQVQQVKDIIEALRLIYFAPRGVISLLDDLANGIRPSQELIEGILTNFNDGEHFVERMRLRLDPAAGQPEGTLSLKAEKVLREISYGKGGVRAKVQNLLNQALTFGEDIPRDEAGELRDEILLLNEAIEDAEEALFKSLRNL